MEDASQGLAASVSTGPSPALRRELRNLLPEAITSLRLRLDIRDYNVTAETPDILTSSTDQWQLRLRGQDEHTAAVLPSPSASNPARAAVTVVNRDGNAVEIVGAIQSQPSATAATPEGPSSSTSTSAALRPCIGALVGTMSSTSSDISSCVTSIGDLAAAMTSNSAPLSEFIHSVGWTLFAQHHTPSEGSLEGDSDTEDGMQANGGGRASHRAAVSGAHGSPWRIGRLAMRYPLTVGLTFANRSHEASFGRWYARHMWKYDAVAMAMCIVFQTVLVFVPGTSYGLFFRLSWTKWAFGYCHVVPLAAILMPRGRTWYQTHRDTALLVLLGAMLIYHHVLLENYRHIGPPAILQCSNVAYSFLWLPFVALLFQMRLRLLGPGIAVATAVNLTLLSDLCQVCPSDPGTMRRCIVRGASKVAAIVAAALFVVYFVEWRARRLWMTLVASSGF